MMTFERFEIQGQPCKRRAGFTVLKSFALLSGSVAFGVFLYIMGSVLIDTVDQVKDLQLSILYHVRRVAPPDVGGVGGSD